MEQSPRSHDVGSHESRGRASCPLQARLGIPAVVGQYHSLVPLEGAGGEAPALGVRSQVLKATSASSGASVALRRLSAQQVGPARLGPVPLA